jgi:hypothetical protein
MDGQRGIIWMLQGRACSAEFENVLKYLGKETDEGRKATAKTRKEESGRSEQVVEWKEEKSGGGRDAAYVF